MRILKYTAVFALLLLVFFIIDISLSEEINILPFEILIVALTTEILIFWPRLRLIFILIANILFLIMVLFFVLNMVDIANIFGSLGFGIFLIASLFYLPQLFKYGCIEKI